MDFWDGGETGPCQRVPIGMNGNMDTSLERSRSGMMPSGMNHNSAMHCVSCPKPIALIVYYYIKQLTIRFPNNIHYYPSLTGRIEN